MHSVIITTFRAQAVLAGAFGALVLNLETAEDQGNVECVAN